MSNALEDYVGRMERARDELDTAGPVHARDLRRQIHRMEKQIEIYKRYQRQARRTKGDGATKTD